MKSARGFDSLQVVQMCMSIFASSASGVFGKCPHIVDSLEPALYQSVGEMGTPYLQKIKTKEGKEEIKNFEHG